ncbi:hypothetical protein HNY73_002026 [Argiope bruennichi]|uniref:Uncharacterized protein n=1 Tax=Argiope bruennichi TaxID=94029 RepID=A0A8T0FSD4_ARGBR|nr:hypothetical protein HNY73_002026 [Argiope bruennichi]
MGPEGQPIAQSNNIWMGLDRHSQVVLPGCLSPPRNWKALCCQPDFRDRGSSPSLQIEWSMMPSKENPADIGSRGIGNPKEICQTLSSDGGRAYFS